MNTMLIRSGKSTRTRLFRWSARAVCTVGLTISTLLAADIDVTTLNDSGPGSLRAGLASAVSGDRLVFDSLTSGSTLTNGSSLVPGQAVTFLNTSATPITLSDSHAYSLSAPLTVDWAGTLNLNGNLSDGGGGAGSLINTGNGTLSLSGTNTYSGGTIIQGGTLQLLSNNAIGSGLLTVQNIVGNPVLNLANGVQLNNNISLQSGLIVNSVSGTTSTINGIISEAGGSYGLSQTGNGTLILSGANTFSGGIYVGGNSTIRAENNAALGTGTVNVSGGLTLDLANGVNIGNKISLNNNFTANVDSGLATLSGTIDEFVTSSLTKTGAGTLVLGGLNSYQGGTIVSQGTLQGDTNSLTGMITNNGTVIFNQAFAGQYSGNIDGSGNLIKNGLGTVILNGSQTYSGPTTVNQGELQVNGSMTSDVTVTSSQATLSGTGTVGNVTNDGIVQPGNSGIGTLNVNGNFTQHADGTTQIGINSAGNTPGTNNGYLNISGQANLGGNLNVFAVGGGTFSTGTQYTILNATGGVSGHYAQVTDNLSMFGVKVNYDANDVVIQLQRTSSLRDVATTSNQTAVATALDSIALSSSGSLFSMINSLGSQTAGQQQQSLNQMSGELFGDTQTIALQTGDVFQQRVTSRLINNGQFLGGQPYGQSTNSDVRGQFSTSMMDSTSGWMQGYGVGGHLQGDGNGAGVSYSQGGAVYGMDLGSDDDGVIGVTGGNSYVSYHDGYGSGGQLTSYQVGLYALKHNELGYLLGTTNYAYDNFGSNRAVTVGGSSQTLRGNYGGNQFGANIETGLKLDAGWLQIQPLMGLQYLYLAQQGFDESGGAAALDVSGSQASSLRTNLGARFISRPFIGRRGAVWRPYGQTRWVAELLDNDRIVNASFNGAPIGGTFTTQGTRIGNNYGIFTKGVQVQLTSQWSLFASVDLFVGTRITTETGSLGALYSW